MKNYFAAKNSHTSFGNYQIVEILLVFLFILLSIFLPLGLNAQYVTTVGPNSAGGGATGPTKPWTNPSNVVSSNNGYAAFSTTSTATTDNLAATGFGFSIPANTIIIGITVEIERKASTNSGTEYVRDNAVYLVNAGADLSATNKAETGTKWPTSDAYTSYGGSTDLWGATLTRAIINSSTLFSKNGIFFPIPNSFATLATLAIIDASQKCILILFSNMNILYNVIKNNCNHK